MRPKEARAAAKAHRTDRQVEIDKKLNRLGKVIAARPVALDTLIKVLGTIQTHPGEQKYRRLRWKNKKFEREIKFTPGAVDFLEAVGFVSEGRDGDLFLSNVDVGLLWSARSVLEKQKTKDVYMEAVKDLEFDVAAKNLISSSPHAALSKGESDRRKAYASNLPPEPKVGSAQQSRIIYVVGKERFERRFRSDASLGHAINYLGSRSSVLARKIADGEWFLLNATTFPSTSLDVGDSGREKTLYSLGLWPSATLQVSRKPATAA